MRLLALWLINALAIMLMAYIVPGIHVAGISSALIVALVLGLLNAVLRPILILLTLPVTILTLGLFTFVINGLILLFVSSIVKGFVVDGFWTAVLGSIVLTLLRWAAGMLFKPKQRVMGGIGIK